MSCTFFNASVFSRSFVPAMIIVYEENGIPNTYTLMPNEFYQQFLLLRPVNACNFCCDFRCDFLPLIDVNEWRVMNAVMYKRAYLHIRDSSTRLLNNIAAIV